MARTDSDERRRKVGIARDLIYNKNMQVSSSAVEALLQDTSLVPTAVTHPTEA